MEDQKQPQGGGPSLHMMDVEVLSTVIRRVVKAFLAIFLLIFITSIIPFQVTQLPWQQNLINVLIGNSPLLLSSLVLLAIASLAAPTRRTSRLALGLVRWALPLCILYVLLIPAQAFLSIRQYGLQGAAAGNSARAAQQRIDTIRDQLESATSPEQLRGALSNVQPQALDQILSQPLPQVRENLLGNLQQAEENLLSRRLEQRRAFRWFLIRLSLRNILSAIVIALALYAARMKRIRSVFTAPLPPPDASASMP